jgi:hypothetical protein
VLPLDAKAPARAGATQTRYFDHRHHSRSPKGAQRTIAVLAEAAVARRFVAPEDRAAVAENATAFAEAVEVRAESMVPRRVRRSPRWAQARALAAALAVDLEIARGQNLEQYPDPLASYPVAVENQSRDLVRHLLDNLDLDDLDTLVVQLAAVLVVLVVSLTYTTPATCRGSARRRRRRRAAATCSRARAARKGAGCHGRPLPPSRVG